MFSKVNSLPTQLKPNHFYIVPNNRNGNIVDIYITNSNGSSYKRILSYNDIEDVINSSNKQLLFIVNNIQERNSLNLDYNAFVFVKDASDDETVNSGFALYLYDKELNEFYKVAEFESLDINIQTRWNDLIGKPSSTPAQIDDAVNKSHIHENLQVIDKFVEDNGVLKYNGKTVSFFNISFYDEW